MPIRRYSHTKEMQMAVRRKKPRQINIRVTQEEHNLINLAAGVSHKSITALVREGALKVANEAMDECFRPLLEELDRDKESRKIDGRSKWAHRKSSGT